MADKKKKEQLQSLYVLPSSNKDLQSFSKEFKIDMMEQVVGSIEFAINNNLPVVEVFQFKNSDFVITLSEKDYLINLNNIYSYYLQNEVYECCDRIIKLLNNIKEKFVNNSDEKQTNKP